MKTRIDSAGRLVIPKALRERYGFEVGAEIEIITIPEGITLVPTITERRIVRRGRIVAVDTGAGVAQTEMFSVDGVRSGQLDRKVRLSS